MNIVKILVHGFLLISLSAGSFHSYGKMIADEKSDSTLNGPEYPYYMNYSFDPDLNMRSGTESLLSLHRGFALLEDKFLGTTWFNENGFTGKSGGILVRLSKYILLDLPVDYFTVVFAHEYFGHGARYREFDFSPVDYGFSLPPPYGNGGGQASINLIEAINYNINLSLWMGGLEMHQLLNRKLNLKWITTNQMNYREASLYFWSFQINMNYIQDSDEDFSIANDNDPRAYIRILNESDGYTDPDTYKFSLAQLKSRVNLNALNPFIFYSIYAIVKTYLYDGKSSGRVPVITIRDWRYLPLIRTSWTPFGIEYHFENYLNKNSRTYLVDLRYGDRSFTNPWAGAGIYAQNLYSYRRLNFDFYTEAWNQPELNLDRNAGFSYEKKPGFATSVRTNYNFENFQVPVRTFVELGYKSRGFIEGYDLNSSLIFSFGLGVAY